MAWAEVATAKAKAANAINLIIVFSMFTLREEKDAQPLRAAGRLSALVVASCRVRQRYFAGIAKIGDFSFQAGFNFAAASLHACAMLFHVIRTGLDVYGLDQDVLALVGQVLDVRLEAIPDLASARLHPWALRLGILQASAGTSAEAIEGGSSNMATPRKRELVIAIRVVI